MKRAESFYHFNLSFSFYLPNCFTSVCTCFNRRTDILVAVIYLIKIAITRIHLSKKEQEIREYLITK